MAKHTYDYDGTEVVDLAVPHDPPGPVSPGDEITTEVEINHPHFTKRAAAKSKES